MENRVKPHSNVMMLELVITVAFFAIISIFLLRIFVAADESEESALMLSKATVIAESTFEYISADEPLDLTSVSEGDSKLLVAYYDKEWNRCDSASVYTMKLYETEKAYTTGKLYTYELVFEKEPRGEDTEATKILSMSTSKYRKGDGVNE
ncbi:MAG: hypothetical protein J6Z02_06255 [Lachnospiraceae bacterium]|nr:hypothetical protein [Lachnospiraceae bacterium]